MCYRLFSQTGASAELGNNTIKLFLLFKNDMVQLYNITHLKSEERIFIINS